MSDYLTKAKRPGSDEWEPVEMRDNYYGPHNYGVQFPDGHVYPDGDCEIIGEKPVETWEMSMTEKQHKPGCKANERCLVYHADGVCPGPYGKCTCDTIPDSSYIPAHEPIVDEFFQRDPDGEKPGETWEERLYALGNECSFDWDGAPERLESFIASEIQSAVEAERRRISEEAAYIESHKAFHCRFDELVKVINPKK